MRGAGRGKDRQTDGERATTRLKDEQVERERKKNKAGGQFKCGESSRKPYGWLCRWVERGKNISMLTEEII